MKMNVTVDGKLRNINCPALIVHSEEGFTVAGAPELAHGLIPHSELAIIRESGHYPFIEQPEVLSETLRRLVDETSATNRNHAHSGAISAVAGFVFRW